MCVSTDVGEEDGDEEVDDVMIKMMFRVIMIRMIIRGDDDDEGDSNDDDEEDDDARFSLSVGHVQFLLAELDSDLHLYLQYLDVIDLTFCHRYFEDASYTSFQVVGPNAFFGHGFRVLMA